jgi:hypothetical protein
MKNFLILSFSLLIFQHCHFSCPAPESVVSGQVTEQIGNCMPSPDRSGPCPQQPFPTVVYFTIPDSVFRPTNVIASDSTDQQGFYSVKLKEASYSIFVSDKGKYVTDYYARSLADVIQVNAGQAVKKNIVINHAFW